MNRQLRHLSVRFPQGRVEPKPTIGQFKNPLFHCFLIASTTYIFMHTVWTSLTYTEREQELKQEVAKIEEKIQALVDAKKEEQQKSSRKWWFW